MTSRIVETRPPDAAWSEQERELLSAARQDRMPAELEARLREALDLPPAAASPTPPEAAAPGSFSDTARARPLFSGKFPLWGMLSIVALGAISYYALTRAPWQPSAASPSSKGATVTSAMPPIAATQRPSTLVSSPGAGATSPNGSVGVHHAEAEVANGAAAPSGGPATSDQLRLEAELLEGARKALAQGALPDAGQWLARYDTRFTQGALKPESEVLAIELKVRTGARRAAKTQAAQFLNEHPHHPLRDRVRDLTNSRARAQ
jgi:hypothetical protein